MIILGSQTFVDLIEHLYTLPGCALGYHYKAFQWLLPICSAPTEVSLVVSVQNHQGPPLAPCGSQESPLLYPLIPNQVDPWRVHSTRSTRWYTKLASTTYYTRSYPYRLMLHYFHGWSLHEPVLRFGHDDYHRLLESTGQSIELSESTEHSSKPVTPNCYSPY
jgi:hypothetical protein